MLAPTDGAACCTGHAVGGATTYTVGATRRARVPTPDQPIANHCREMDEHRVGGSVREGVLGADPNQHDKSAGFSFIVQSRVCRTTPTTKRPQVLQAFFLSLMITGSAEKPDEATANASHRLGPSYMPVELKRSRHVAVAIPEVRVSRGITASPRQESPQPQQPDVTYHQTLFGWRGR
jgi:hypothetical protein